MGENAVGLSDGSEGSLDELLDEANKFGPFWQHECGTYVTHGCRVVDKINMRQD